MKLVIRQTCWPANRYFATFHMQQSRIQKPEEALTVSCMTGPGRDQIGMVAGGQTEDLNLNSVIPSLR